MNGPVLRLVDANANRAREALRVIEDYARFVLNADPLCSTLKSIRHDLTQTLAGVLPHAILHRDTPGDVGTAITTPEEGQRDDLTDIVIAAGKRLGEALRAIEEGLKAVAPEQSPRVETLRYRFYDVEQRIVVTLRPHREQLQAVQLYVLITASLCGAEWLSVAQAAIEGGADALQLREKDLESASLLYRARHLVDLCHARGVLCIINDRPDIAVLSGADGVHVGQDDLPAAEVRRLVGNDKIIGVSTHNLAQARQAVLESADYIGVGPFFPSQTKPRDFLAGPAFAKEAAAQVAVPAIAIGGITAANVDEVLATGVRRVAVSSAVCGAADPRAVAEALKGRLTRGV